MSTVLLQGTLVANDVMDGARSRQRGPIRWLLLTEFPYNKFR
jgi:hypothetical protein